MTERGMFEPADGVEARWKKVYQQLRGMKVGDVLTYAKLEGMFPGLERHSLQSVIRRAAKEYLEEDKRGLRNLRGEGYRVIDPAEHVEVARWHQERSVKSLKRGHSAVTNVDYNGLSPDLRALTEATGRALTLQLDYIRRVDVRQKKLQETVEQTVVRTEANERELQQLKERLDRLEEK